MRGAKSFGSTGRLPGLLVILIAVYPALVYAGPDPAVELEYTFPEPMLEKVAF